MANWQTAVVTDKGKALIAKVTAGTTQLNITRAAIGRGNPSNLVQATALANAIGAAEIITKVAKNNTTTVTVRITNAAFSQLESISELGLFATDPDEGEILFCVMVDSNPDQVQAASNSTLVAKTITMGIGYDNADNVTVVLSNTAWVTAEEVLAMITDELRKYGNTTHKIVDSTVALNSAQTMTALTDMLGNRLKAITGETSWVTDPADTIKNIKKLLGFGGIGAQSLGANSYVKFANGIIIQKGVLPSTGVPSGSKINFIIPMKDYQVFMNDDYASSDTSNPLAYSVDHWTSNTYFTVYGIRVKSTSTVLYGSWLAIGWSV